MFSVWRLVVCGINCLLLAVLIIGKFVLMFNVSYCWLLFSFVLLCSLLVSILAVVLLVMIRKCFVGCLNYSKVVVFFLIICFFFEGSLLKRFVSAVCVWKLVILSSICLLFGVMVILENIVYFFSLVSCGLCMLCCLIYVKLLLLWNRCKLFYILFLVL